MKRWLAAVLYAPLLFGCAHSSTIPLSADTIRITTSAAPVCGATGAQSVAFRRAAIETINRGFDRFLVLGSDAQNNVRVVGTTPVTATTNIYATGNTFGNATDIQGTATTSYSGGQPIIAGSHDQFLIVKMFRETDAGAQNAISARTELGEKWPEIVKENARTTC
jgi:hypothetical protein